MYLPQFQEICEKQGWDFKWSDDGKNAYITLMTLPNKHLFIVNKDNFAKEVTALSETYLLDEYAKTSGSCAPIFCEDFAVSAALSALAAALNVAAVRDVANGVVKTRLDAIRSLDKLRLAIFLNDIHSNVKDFPSDNLSWCDWLNKPDDGHLLDAKTAR